MADVFDVLFRAGRNILDGETPCTVIIGNTVMTCIMSRGSVVSSLGQDLEIDVTYRVLTAKDISEQDSEALAQVVEQAVAGVRRITLNDE